MILSGQDIKRFNLLENADESLMQAQGWDVRLDKVYRVVNKPFGEKIKEEDYEEPYRLYQCSGDIGANICQIMDVKDRVLRYDIGPNSSALFKLKEIVNLKPVMDRSHDHLRYFNALVLPKSSLSRRGISVHSAWWDAGYRGSGVVLVRTSEVPLRITPGEAFGQMIFFEGTSTDEVYRGQYQGEGIKV
jgi:deoxycytidine triphosphate deaminase